MKNKSIAKKNFWTIPNLFNLFRLFLIPLIIWLYCGKKQYITAIALIAVSGASYIIDRIIAERSNSFSNIGKILMRMQGLHKKELR